MQLPAIAPAPRLESARAMVELYDRWQQADPNEEQAALGRLWDERRRGLEASQTK